MSQYRKGYAIYDYVNEEGIIRLGWLAQFSDHDTIEHYYIVRNALEDILDQTEPPTTTGSA